MECRCDGGGCCLWRNGWFFDTEEESLQNAAQKALNSELEQVSCCSLAAAPHDGYYVIKKCKLFSRNPVMRYDEKKRVQMSRRRGRKYTRNHKKRPPSKNQPRRRIIKINYNSRIGMNCASDSSARL